GEEVVGRSREGLKPAPTGPSRDSANEPNAVDRGSFLGGAAAGAATLAFPRITAAETGLFAFDDDLTAIRSQVDKRHDEAVRRLQTWIRQPSIAAENRGMNEGCELTMQMLREAGFDSVAKVTTDGQP